MPEDSIWLLNFIEIDDERGSYFFILKINTFFYFFIYSFYPVTLTKYNLRYFLNFQCNYVSVHANLFNF